jgi:hypothetical protein
MTFNQYLLQRLEQIGITEAEFRELIIRLVNYSVIVRDESQTEQVLFDRLIRARQLVEEYLSIMGIQLLVDSRFEYVRVYPPASEIPGVKEAEENAWSGSLRQRLSQFQVALVLVVRAQYEKSLREGKIDEKGFALESIESLTIAAKNLLGRNLPEKLAERKKIFQRLRQLRLINFRSDENFESGEGWIKIHPMIVTFVSSPAVDAIVAGTSESIVQDDEADRSLADKNEVDLVFEALDVGETDVS